MFIVKYVDMYICIHIYKYIIYIFDNYCSFKNCSLNYIYNYIYYIYMIMIECSETLVWND